MKKRNIILLDIDGVLATTTNNSLYAPTNNDIHKKYNAYPFNPECVKVLNEILLKTNAEIVLTSRWNFFYNLEELNDIFEMNGIIKPISDIAQDVKIRFSSTLEMDRAEGIKKYLNNHTETINNYVIVDDLPMNENFKKEVFVWCDDSVKGITLDGVKEKIISILNEE